MQKITTIIIWAILIFSFSSLNAQNSPVLNKLILEAGDNTYLKDFKFELKPGEEKQFYSIQLKKRTLYEWYAYLADYKQLKITLYNNFGYTVFQSKETDKGIINFSVKCNKDSKYVLNIKNISKQAIKSTILLTSRKKLNEDETLVTNPKLEKILDASNDTYLKDFQIKLAPLNEVRQSVVLSRNTTYSISTYFNEPNQFDVKLYDDKSEKELIPKTLNINEDVKYQLYSISNTGVYHLIVRNISTKNAETVTLLALHGTWNEASALKQENPDNKEFKEEKSYYFIVDKMPKFNGKNSNEFKNFIQQEIRYPQEASENNIEGKVFVTFIVGKNGYVKDAKVVRGAHPSIDQEALRVVYSSPRWEPGIKNNEPVDVMFTFPITFKLP